MTTTCTCNRCEPSPLADEDTPSYGTTPTAGEWQALLAAAALTEDAAEAAHDTPGDATHTTANNLDAARTTRRDLVTAYRAWARGVDTDHADNPDNDR